MGLKELGYLILFALVIGFVLAFPLSNEYSGWLKYGVIAFVILGINLLIKKAAASKLDCNIEYTPWVWQRYWLYERSYFKFPIPMWLIWPIALVWLTVGKIKWLAVSSFDVTARTSRTARRYAEVTEWDIAVIAAAGLAINIFIAIVAEFLGYHEFALLNMWFVFFNVLPLPAYDGGKILFGEKLFFIFIFTFIIIMLILMHIATLLTTIISAIMLAIIAVFIFYGLRER